MVYSDCETNVIPSRNHRKWAIGRIAKYETGFHLAQQIAETVAEYEIQAMN